MRFKAMAAVVGAAVLASAGGAVAEESKPPAHKCVMYQVGELKVRLVRNQPLLDGAINGQPAVVLFDTGASRSMLYRSRAEQMHLALTDMPGMRMGGAGGVSIAQSALLNELEIAGFKRRGVNMLVAGEGTNHAFDLILGEDVFGTVDLEFDLAHGVVRMLQPKGCTDEDMPYWAKGAYGQTPLVERGGQTVGLTVQLNGRPVRAILDSGASTSVATPDVAAAIGAKLGDSEGKGYGLGGVTTSRIGELDTFTIGDETIRNTRLRFSDLFSNTRFGSTGSHIARPADDLPQMLLGVDFLKSHHVLISRSRRMVYFTYEGGAVFDTAHHPAAPAAPAASIAPAAAAASASDANGRVDAEAHPR